MKRDAKANVLIVDNDDRILMTFEELLENAGFNTLSTWSGLEALCLLQSGRFDVLLVDDFLPDLHSHDFLQRVGALPIQPWVVVMQTAVPTSSDFRQYQWLGATSVINKRDLKALCEAVHNCCAEKPLTLIN